MFPSIGLVLACIYTITRQCWGIREFIHNQATENIKLATDSKAIATRTRILILNEGTANIPLSQLRNGSKLAKESQHKAVARTQYSSILKIMHVNCLHSGCEQTSKQKPYNRSNYIKVEINPSSLTKSFLTPGRTQTRFLSIAQVLVSI